MGSAGLDAFFRMDIALNRVHDYRLKSSPIIKGIEDTVMEKVDSIFDKIDTKAELEILNYAV